MLLIDKMIVGGVRFVLDKLMVAVEQERNDDTSLREELLAAQMKVELGEMTQEEFTALEDEVLAAIREIRERTGRGGGPIDMSQGGAGSSAESREQRTLSSTDIASIDASFVADDFYGDEPASAAVVEAPAPLTGATPSKRPRRAAPKKKTKTKKKKSPSASSTRRRAK